ncbi:amidohydrolase [Actinacidiphila glaucinigra]|uniref:amidohydrolase n=1 Tax=Actinacidiphila glaucinigra TaxID=235986 RepID=UPI0038630299
MDEQWEQVYVRVTEQLTARAETLWEVAATLHADPEPAFAEERAARLLTGHLEDEGFTVRRGVAGLPTAFVATAGDGGRPRVALLLEYDALPGLGHACGHNLIAAAGLGAGLALHAAMPDVGGSLLVVGTPAEERGGGKVVMAEAGVFDGVDAALMFHPGVHSWSWAPLTASAQIRVAFHGRAAHPTGNPTEGIDALAALIQFFNTLAVLGRHLPAGSHVQGIVTEGGKVTNVIPEYAEGLFGLRGATTAARDELAERLSDCAQGVARATGARAEASRVDAGYDHFRNNAVLSSRFTAHLARAGVQAGEPAPSVYLGSSDVGTVSNLLPTIHPFVAIMDGDGSDHTPQFAAAAAGPRARAAMLAAAQALACTAADALVDPGVTAAAWAEHRHPDD